MLTQDELKCVRVYSVSPTTTSSKASGTKEVQLDRTTDGKTREQNSKQEAMKRKTRQKSSSDGGGKKEEREWIKEKRRR